MIVRLLLTCLAATALAAGKSLPPSRPATAPTTGPTTAPAVVESRAARAFRALCAAKAAAAEEAGHFTSTGRDEWLFFAPELRHLGVGTFWGGAAAKVSLAPKPEWADPLPAILDFKAQLDRLGIELIFLPVPPKATIYPDKLSEKVAVGKDGMPPRLDTHLQAFYKLLRAGGVDVLDLTDEFRRQRRRLAGKRKLYCQSDTHWSPTACSAAARAVRRHINARPWFTKIAPRKGPFSLSGRTIAIHGDLWRMLGREASAKETLNARRVWYTGDKDRKPVPDDRSSPILLLGDSHCLVFHGGKEMHAAGSGLADCLSWEANRPIDVLGVRGSGATASRISLYRRERRNKGYLAGKKLIIWCLSAREFTEADGWRRVPLVKPM